MPCILSHDDVFNSLVKTYSNLIIILECFFIKWNDFKHDVRDQDYALGLVTDIITSITDFNTTVLNLDVSIKKYHMSLTKYVDACKFTTGSDVSEIKNLRDEYNGDQDRVDTDVDNFYRCNGVLSTKLDDFYDANMFDHPDDAEFRCKLYIFR